MKMTVMWIVLDVAMAVLVVWAATSVRDELRGLKEEVARL